MPSATLSLTANGSDNDSVMFHRLPFTVYYHFRFSLCSMRFALCVSVDIAPTVPMGYIWRARTFFA